MLFRHGGLLCMLLNKEVYQDTCVVGEGDLKEKVPYPPVEVEVSAPL